MTNEENLREYWKLLCLFEDYVAVGFERKHAEPDFSVPDSASEKTETSTPGGKNAVAAELAGLSETVASCRKCRLCEGRKKTVPGEGVERPLALVIGEGPGADEDASGRPFVGRAGKYLDQWLKAISLDRTENCYIANVVKCRPPNNRDPQPDEVASCLPYLERQIELLKPKVIITVGRISSRVLLGVEESMNRLHGRRFEFRGIPLVPTYHPSAVLRDPDLRRPVWQDLKVVRGIIDE